MPFDLVKNNIAALNNERLAKIRNHGDVKLQTCTVCSLRFPMKNLALKVSTLRFLIFSRTFQQKRLAQVFGFMSILFDCRTQWNPVLIDWLDPGLDWVTLSPGSHPGLYINTSFF